MLCRWIIALSALLACAVACFPDQSLSQNWVGELKIGDTKRFVQLRTVLAIVDAIAEAGVTLAGVNGDAACQRK